MHPSSSKCAYYVFPVLNAYQLFSDNDPWNPIGTSSVNPSTINQIDSFSGLQTNLSSGLNGGINALPPSKSNNDPWNTQTSEGSQGSQSIDPFSPVAQRQLAEFDVLRDQMEHPVTATGMGSESNNGGKLNILCIF